MPHESETDLIKNVFVLFYFSCHMKFAIIILRNKI